MASARANAPDEGVLRLAQSMVADGLPPPVDLPDDIRRALAWALKTICHASWSSDPQRAVRAAEAVCALHANNAARADHELAALAQWMAGVAHVIRGEMASAVGCFDAAAERFRGLGRPHEAAETQVPKIAALTMLGRYEEAVATANRTHRDFVLQGDEHAAAKVSLNLGSLHLRREQYGDAARHYRESAVRFARAGDYEHSVMADIGIADALTALAEFDEALRIYARAGMRAATHRLPVLEAIREESVALLQLARGHYRDALGGLERSRARYETLAMPQHLAIAEKQLADAYLQLRLLPEALALYDQAIEKFRQQTMPDEIAWTLSQRGRAQALLGQSEAAAASLTHAAQMFAGQRNVVGESAVTLARAELALACGDIAAALPLAAQATTGFSDAGLPEPRARAEATWAEALLRRGAVAQSRSRFSGVLERARELQLLPVQVRCLTGEGLAALAMQDSEAAGQAFKTAVELFEQQRRALPGDDIRTAFLTDHLVPYRELMRLALRDHQRRPTIETAATVVADLDRFRARALAERLAHGVEMEDDASTSTRRAHLNWLRRRVQRAYDEGAEWAALAAELRRSERELLERERRRRLVAHVPSASAYDEPLDTHALRDSLGMADAIIEYGVVDDELFACVVTHGDIVVCRGIARWSDTLEALRSTRFQIETLSHGDAHVGHRVHTLVERAQARLARLHALIWAPLAPALAGCRRMLVVPHGELVALPFAALHDGSSHLVDHFEIAVAPSARLALRGLARDCVPARNALAVGVADRVPHAADEASLVASLYPGARALLGEQARVDEFRTASPEADVIHLACHAQFRSDNPMFSALQLNDGALTVEMAERLRLRPGIVVLSACETGLADQRVGDEMVGLVRAFFVAGAARVIASLWPVDDAVTGETMGALHRALRDGMTPAAALRRSQREMMLRHRHPFYWSAFTLYGGW